MGTGVAAGSEARAGEMQVRYLKKIEYRDEDIKSLKWNISFGSTELHQIDSFIFYKWRAFAAILFFSEVNSIPQNSDNKP